MATDKSMAGYARDCIRLAGLTSDPEIREQLLKMAGQWTEAASGNKQQQAATQAPQASANISVRSRSHVAGSAAKKHSFLDHSANSPAKK
jgi:hypothetical protein